VTAVADEVRKLAADLGKIPKDVQKELRPQMRGAARPIVADMRRRASWSKRIPRAVSVSTSFTSRRGGVFIRVSARKAPHARFWENQGRLGTTRHPVFPDSSKPRREWRWAPERSRPFALPSARAGHDDALTAVATAVDNAARKHGFR
jgi:hypothetical protein